MPGSQRSPPAIAACSVKGCMDLHPFALRAGLCILETEVGTALRRTIQVRISRGDRQFVAECLDLPVVTQAATLDELAFNIREAIGLHLEGEDLAALGFSTNPTILATMELEAVA